MKDFKVLPLKVIDSWNLIFALHQKMSLERIFFNTNAFNGLPSFERQNKMLSVLVQG